MRKVVNLSVIYLEDIDLFLPSRLKAVEDITRYDIKDNKIISNSHIVIFMRDGQYKLLKSYL